MGDRVSIIFQRKDELAPTIFMKWGGETSFYMLEDHFQWRAEQMVGWKGRSPSLQAGPRWTNPAINAANFIRRNIGPQWSNSIFIFNTPDLEIAKSKDSSPGDAGTIIVNTETEKWVQYHGDYVPDRYR